MTTTHRSSAIGKLFERAYARMPSTPAPTASLTLSQAQRIKTIVEGMDAIAFNRNPTETDAAHAVRLSKAAASVKSEVAKSMAIINQNLNNGVQNIRQKIDEATGLRMQSPVASEIRTAFRSLTLTERAEVISKAIKERDTEILSSVLGVHPFLSGLDASYAQEMKSAYEELVAPDLVAETEALIEIDAEVAALLRTAEMAADEAVEPDYIARVGEAARRAEQAQSEFASATSAAPPIAAE